MDFCFDKLFTSNSDGRFLNVFFFETSGGWKTLRQGGKWEKTIELSFTSDEPPRSLSFRWKWKSIFIYLHSRIIKDSFWWFYNNFILRFALHKILHLDWLIFTLVLISVIRRILPFFVFDGKRKVRRGWNELA